MRKWVDSLADLGVDDILFIPAINRLDAHKRSKELATIVDRLPLDDETTAINITARLRDRKWWIVAIRLPVEQNAAFIKRSNGKIERHTAEPARDISRLFRLMKRAGKSFNAAMLVANNPLEIDFVRRLYGKVDNISRDVHQTEKDDEKDAHTAGVDKIWLP